MTRQFDPATLEPRLRTALFLAMLFLSGYALGNIAAKMAAFFG